MTITRVGKNSMTKSGYWYVVVTPLDGSEKAYRPKNQPKGMTQAQAFDWADEYKRSIPVATDVHYKGA